MKQSDLIHAVATHSLAPKTLVATVLASLSAVSLTALASGDDIPLPGLGILKTAKREARDGRNPITGNKLRIAAKTVPKFSAGAALKAAVNAPAKKVTRKK